MLLVLALIAWVGCVHGWRQWRTCVGDQLSVVGVFALMSFSEYGVPSELMWVVCYYYCYCYYGNTILKKQMLNVFLLLKQKQK